MRTLNISEDTADTLFIDLLNEHLELILSTNTSFIHGDDFNSSMRISKAISILMQQLKTDAEHKQWLMHTLHPLQDAYISHEYELNAIQDAYTSSEY